MQPSTVRPASLARLARSVLGHMRRAPSTPPLEALRCALMAQIIDCDPTRSRSVRLGIKTAGSAQQLWLLRSEVFQVVGQEFGQHEAERRLIHLAPLFEHVAPMPKRPRYRT